MGGKAFVAYYRDIQVKRQPRDPNVSAQQEWVRDRVASHPSGSLVGEFTEFEEGWENPKAGQPFDRPQLERAIQAAKEIGATLLIPDVGRKYAYPSIPLAAERNNVGWISIRPPVVRDFAPAASQSPGVIQVWDEADDPAFFQKIWKMVEVECGHFLQIVRKAKVSLLFRGMPEVRGVVYKAVPRIDRGPRDTAPDLHDRIDQWMEGKGIAARRSNSIACSPHPRIAANFTQPRRDDVEKGMVYAIFPCDGFAYSWCRGEQDLAAGIYDDFSTERLEHILWRADIVEGDLAGALEAEHEVLITGGAYIAISWERFRESITKAVGFKLHNEAYDEHGVTEKAPAYYEER